MTHNALSDDIKQLNSFLRGEISAMETYTQALDNLDHQEHPQAAQVLRQNLSSHETRVSELRAEITRLGGDPEEGSGAWGTFAKAIEGGAAIFGDSAAVSALEDGEDHGLNDYRGDLEDLSPATRQFVAKRLLPEQTKTHRAVSQLKDLM